jgi:hypothetical protein
MSPVISKSELHPGLRPGYLLTLAPCMPPLYSGSLFLRTSNGQSVGILSFEMEKGSALDRLRELRILLHAMRE